MTAATAIYDLPSIVGPTRIWLTNRHGPTPGQLQTRAFHAEQGSVHREEQEIRPRAPARRANAGGFGGARAAGPLTCGGHDASDRLGT